MPAGIAATSDFGRPGFCDCRPCQCADAVNNLPRIEATLAGEPLPVPPPEVIAPAFACDLLREVLRDILPNLAAHVTGGGFPRKVGGENRTVTAGRRPWWPRTARGTETSIGGKALNQFNGGLFVHDDDLEKLHVPNSVFCQHMQGANEASLYSFKETLLYLCDSYNYASDLGRADGVRSFDRDPSKSLGLYTLGRIFEQSITELEILEAEADNRPSINKESKRKRDGVYYTPEWVVERIVDETLGPRLAEIKKECGWPAKGDPTLEAIDAYSARLKNLTVLDPACGSGAFLITVLRYLVEAWHEVQAAKTRLIRFGRHAAKQREELGEEKPETFDSLGFTHFCTRSRKWGSFVIGRKTIKKRMLKQLQAVKMELRRRMHDPIARTGVWLNQMLKGHLNYYAVSGNSPSLWWYFNAVRWRWLKSLRRRSQRAFMNWEKFTSSTDRFFPSIRIPHPLPCHRFDARTRGRSPVR